eukprot:912220-Prorocentrum_minimum.AAC.2
MKGCGGRLCRSHSGRRHRGGRSTPLIWYLVSLPPRDEPPVRAVGAAEDPFSVTRGGHYQLPRGHARAWVLIGRPVVDRHRVVCVQPHASQVRAVGREGQRRHRRLRVRADGVGVRRCRGGQSRVERGSIEG